MLFMIVFAIIGLHVYGGTQQSDEYPNFGTFLLSVTTMFQVCLTSNMHAAVVTVIVATEAQKHVILLTG